MTIYDPISEALDLESLDIDYKIVEGIDYIPIKGPMPDYMKENLRELTLQQFKDPEMRKTHQEACKSPKVNHSDKIWVNDGNKNKRIYPFELHKYPNFVKGRLIPKSCKFGNYNKTGENNPFYGKGHSKKTKQKISNSQKGKVPHNYGKKMKWITNNIDKKQIHIDEELPNGWHRGRKRKVLK